MKKIVYLLLITLLFAGCKKDNKDKDATNKVAIKGKWKTTEVKVEYYDAYGNIVRSKNEEIKPEDFFYVELDGNNKVIFTDFNDTNECTGAYVYQNGCLAIIKDGDDNKKVNISQPTENSMVWQFEPVEFGLDDNIEEDFESDDIEEDAIDGTAPQNSISQQIVKTILCFSFIKVSK